MTGYTGPGVWIRIQHRFGARLPEWQLSFIIAALGGVLFLPGDLFAQPAWTAFHAIFGSEHVLGAIMIFLGALRIGGLIVNGARRQVTPWIRVVSASVGFMIFVGLTYTYALSGFFGPWLAFYPAFAVTELFNIHRAARDAGESNGIS